MACRHLERQGLTILARNYRVRFGELDIVAEEAGTLVFVEVKERRGDSHGEAWEAVSWSKRQKIIRTAHSFVWSRGLSEVPVRFDVVSIDWNPQGRPTLRHDRGAFDSSGA